MNSIKTERLLLRRAKIEDLQQLHKVFSSANAMKYWDTLPHSNVAETENFIISMIATPQGQGADYVVEFNETVIGKAGFWKFPEIGFIFHPEYWGMGLATEAVSALIEYGFEAKNLQAITADVDPRNSRSIRLLESLGFTETHREANTIKVGDDWCDSVYFVLRSAKVKETR